MGREVAYCLLYRQVLGVIDKGIASSRPSDRRLNHPLLDSLSYKNTKSKSPPYSFPVVVVIKNNRILSMWYYAKWAKGRGLGVRTAEASYGYRLVNPKWRKIMQLHKTGTTEENINRLLGYRNISNTLQDHANNASFASLFGFPKLQDGIYLIDIGVVKNQGRLVDLTTLCEQVGIKPLSHSEFRMSMDIIQESNYSPFSFDYGSDFTHSLHSTLHYSSYAHSTYYLQDCLENMPLDVSLSILASNVMYQLITPLTMHYYANDNTHNSSDDLHDNSEAHKHHHHDRYQHPKYHVPIKCKHYQPHQDTKVHHTPSNHQHNHDSSYSVHKEEVHHERGSSVITSHEDGTNFMDHLNNAQIDKVWMYRNSKHDDRYDYRHENTGDQLSSSSFTGLGIEFNLSVNKKYRKFISSASQPID